MPIGAEITGGRFSLPSYNPRKCWSGEVAEWLKAPHSKCGILARVSWVQIPPSPPPNFEIASVISPGDNGRPLHIMTAAKTR